MRKVACVAHVVAVAVLVMSMAAPVAAQTVLISNLPGNDGTQSAGLDDLRTKAMGFTMPAGQDYTLQYVTLRLETAAAGATPIVELWTNSGGQLGALIETLTSPPLAASGIAEYDFTSAGSILTGGESYWILAYGPAGVTDYDWKASSPAELPTGIASHLGALFGTAGPPPTGTSSIICSYSVTGTLVPVELQSFTID